MFQNGSNFITSNGSGTAAVINTHNCTGAKRNGIHYAWVICIACTVMMYCNSGITDGLISVYEPYIVENFGISNTQISLMLTVKSITSLLAVVVSGIFYKKLSLRAGGIFTMLLCGGSFVMYGFANSFPAFLLASVVLGIGNGMGTSIPISTAYGLWFKKKRKLAMSITTFASSVGLIGLPEVLTHIIEGRSLRTAFLLNAAMAFAGMAVVFLLFRNNPWEMGLKPYGDGENEEADKCSRHAGLINAGNDTAEDRSLTKGDWMLLAPACVAIGIICCTSYSYFTLFLKNEGVSAAAIARLLTLTGISVGTGKLSYGWLADKLGPYVCNRIYFIATIVGIALLTLFVHNGAVLIFATVIMGFGAPLGSVGFVSWAWDLGGHMSAEAIRKMQICLYAGMMAFNFIPGVIADFNGGSYSGIYLMYAILGIPTFLAVQYLYRKKGLNKKV